MKAIDLIAECGHPLNEGCGWEQAPADPKVRPTGWKPSMGNKFVEDPKTGEHVQLVYRCGPAPQNTSSMLAPGKRGFGYNDEHEFSGDTDLTNLSWKEQGKVGKKFLKNKAAVKRDPTIKIDPEAAKYLESKTTDITKLQELAGLSLVEAEDDLAKRLFNDIVAIRNALRKGSTDEQVEDLIYELPKYEKEVLGANPAIADAYETIMAWNQDLPYPAEVDDILRAQETAADKTIDKLQVIMQDESFDKEFNAARRNPYADSNTR